MKALFGSIRSRLNHTTRIQVLSDLHLEVGQQYSTYTFPASAPFLLLAGDIGRLIDYDAYLGFLEAQVARYKKVFLVLGNHEFYGLDYRSGLDAARLSQRNHRWPTPSCSFTELGGMAPILT